MSWVLWVQLAGLILLIASVGVVWIREYATQTYIAEYMLQKSEEDRDL